MARMNTIDRRKQLLETACKLSRDSHYQRVTRGQVGEALNVSPSLLTSYWKTMAQFRRDIVREAVRTKDLKIIAQAIVAKDPHIKKLSQEVRKQALEQYI